MLPSGIMCIERNALPLSLSVSRLQDIIVRPLPSCIHKFSRVVAYIVLCKIRSGCLCAHSSQTFSSVLYYALGIRWKDYSLEVALILLEFRRTSSFLLLTHINTHPYKTHTHTHTHTHTQLHNIRAYIQTCKISFRLLVVVLW